jgi:two-component system cell cycle response regulator DivK
MKSKKARPANSGCLILIVDDAEEMRSLRKEFLEREGYRVIEAEDGKQGVEAAIRERPGLILMNYLMPVMNGLEATRLIRQQPSLKSLPILMNSACQKESMWDEAMLAGCDDYLEEPYFFEELLDKVGGFTALSNKGNSRKRADRK